MQAEPADAVRIDVRDGQITRAARALIARVEIQPPSEVGGRSRLELLGEFSALLAAAGVEGLGGNAKTPLAYANGVMSSALGDAGTRRHLDLLLVA